MSSIAKILQAKSHRQWAVPRRSWKYYQEWHDVFFLHWPVPVKMLAPLLPAGLQLDLFNGEAWISVVGFTVKNMHPRFLPSFPPLSDFHEINVRTYVTVDNRPGIYFLSIEAQKLLVMLMARI